MQSKIDRIKKNIFNKSEEQIIERILTLKQIIKENRSSPIDYHELAINYFLLKNYDKCINSINELIKNYPDYIDINRAIKLKIVCLIFLNDYDLAIKEITKRLEINPQDTLLLSCLAYSLEKKKYYKKAIEIHRKILDIEPEKTSSLNAYGYLLTLYGPKEFLPHAETYIKKALEKDPNNPCYLDSYAVYLNKIGKKELAKKYILKALSIDPQNIEILTHLKEILKEKNLKK
jgi:tetratricopeptide (TPR) repeat protein